MSDEKNVNPPSAEQAREAMQLLVSHGWLSGGADAHTFHNEVGSYIGTVQLNGGALIFHLFAAPDTPSGPAAASIPK